MPRRILEGNVVSSKCDKTVTVLVERTYMHPVYKKYIKSTDKYTAHDENNQFNEGDRISIIECRPISKRKRWTVVTGDENDTPKDTKKASKLAAKKVESKSDEKAKKKAPVKKEAPKAEEKKPAAKKKAPVKKTAAKKTKATKKDA